jgi:hypothetical protein
LPEVKRAILDHADNLSDAAMALGVCRETLSRWVSASPELQAWRKEVRVQCFDDGVSKVREAYNRGEPWAIKAWLERFREGDECAEKAGETGHDHKDSADGVKLPSYLELRRYARDDVRALSHAGRVARAEAQRALPAP